ncbi:12409_t:CDS:1 [Acaulospora colombiana]|uniref:12409_t:CDS:1 n=1 Tax=Acaulospora colombiana TaxID=27376 RepID=A0ACA9MDL6_9GLOM|nr:12409_t:CDS:1 [Acaulospora colombiana]
MKWSFRLNDVLSVPPKFEPASPLTSFDLKQPNRYRMHMTDTPDLLEYIEKSKFKDSIPSPTENLSFDLSRFSLNHLSSRSYGQGHVMRSPISNHKEIEMGFGKGVRKHPYPVRAPSISLPGIFKVDTVLKDPTTASLRGNNDEIKLSSPVNASNTPSPSESPFTSECRSSTDDEATSRRLLHRKQQRSKQAVTTKRTGTSAAQRKRKGNSLARVMTDRGLLESIFNSNITSNDIKSVRIPPPPPMQFDELISNIRALSLNTEVLDEMAPEITWKGQPLSIAHLPHYDALHPTEAHVVSVLRLTPVQYLTGKYTLVSAAQRYVHRALPFKKSDAQKLLRIDVNKASKLWEFFRQVRWI